MDNPEKLASQTKKNKALTQQKISHVKYVRNETGNIIFFSERSHKHRLVILLTNS